MASPKQVVAVDPHSMFFISFCLPLSFYVFFLPFYLKARTQKKKKRAKIKKGKEKTLKV